MKSTYKREQTRVDTDRRDKCRNIVLTQLDLCYCCANSSMQKKSIYLGEVTKLCLEVAMYNARCVSAVANAKLFNFLQYFFSLVHFRCLLYQAFCVQLFFFSRLADQVVVNASCEVSLFYRNFRDGRYFSVLTLPGCVAE